MSRRTSEASRAIAKAWENEQKLVAKGKGTRDWTAQQQRDIQKYGKAYDENGCAFEGQHMKSVEKYPSFQGDPRNIQFLTKAEHLLAHGGNWQNPTNWYYNPVAKRRRFFPEDDLIPCKPKKLSDPVFVVASDISQNISQNSLKFCDCCDNISTEVSKEQNYDDIIAQIDNYPRDVSLLEKICNAASAFKSKHPIITEIVFGGINFARSCIEEKIYTGDICSEPTTDSQIDLANNKLVHNSNDNNIQMPDFLSSNDELNSNKGTGTPKTPHVRKAHPTHCWVKNENGEKVREVRMIEEIYVNKDKANDIDNT